MATSRSSRVSRARYTSPIPPAPRAERISNGPRRVPEVRATGALRIIRVRNRVGRYGVAFQLRISVIDGGSIASVAALIRNRSPSGETTYCWRVMKL